MSNGILILGNQLLTKHPALAAYPEAPIIMIEAHDLCGHLPYHKHKLMLILVAMRAYAEQLEGDGHTVHYTKLTADSNFNSILINQLKDLSIKKLVWMQPYDRAPHNNLLRLAKQQLAEHEILPNKQFMLEAEEFESWFTKQKSPKMEHFYRWHRKRTNILMDNAAPIGGEWNYDHNNRKALPKSGISIPSLPEVTRARHMEVIAGLIEKHFPDNPGSTESFWLPTDQEAAKNWLTAFVQNRLENFGPYEDAMQRDETFLFHSALSPLLNIGLLTPQQVIDAAVTAYDGGGAPIESVEGFVRQVMGWREYMYGLYWQKPELTEANYFEFDRPLEDWWYTDEWQKQALPIPVQHALKTVHAWGYNHHIERLMILGNWFLLNEYNPQSVSRWFRAMYVDAYDWVMVTNVQGMSQYADGGFVATKPYISGGNYLQKMGRFWDSMAAARDSEFNRLYWQFLNAHRDKLKDNPRMSLVLNQASKHRQD